MKTNMMRVLMLGVALTQLVTTSTFAANYTNHRTSFQGLLQTSAGAAVADGTYNARIKFHNNAGTVLWGRDAMSITTKNGVFTASITEGLVGNIAPGNVAFTSALLDISATASDSLQVDVAVDLLADLSYSSSFTNIAIQPVPVALIADICMSAKGVAAGAIVPASLTAGDFSAALTSGTYSINISGNAATATSVSGGVTGGNVSMGAANNISYAAGTGTFDQSLSSGIFSTGSGANTLNGNVTISGAKTFSSGTGAVSLNGATTVAANFSQTGANTFGTGTGAVSLNGATTVAANFSQTGATTFGTGTGAVSLNGATTVAANFSQTGATTFGTGTGTFTHNGPVSMAGGQGITYAAGAGGFDQSLATTGIFKTGGGAVTIGPGAVTVSGAVTQSTNFSQTGATTFGTGTGAVSINGSATFAAGKTLLTTSTGGATLQGGVNVATDAGGAANTVTLTTTPAMTAIPATGTVLWFKKTTAANTGAVAAVTVNGFAIGALQWKGAALTGGELQLNSWYEILFDGTNSQILTPIVLTGSAGAVAAGTAANIDASWGTVTVTGAATTDLAVCMPTVAPASATRHWSAYVSAANTITVLVGCLNNGAVCTAWSPGWKCWVYK